MTAPCLRDGRWCYRCQMYRTPGDARTETACKTCGHLTFMTGTKLCDACWEVEHRLDSYLSVGGAEAIAFVEAALARARG